MNNNLQLKKSLSSKYDIAKRIISSNEGVLVAFSGGCDSSLLLKISVDALGSGNVVAITALSPTYPSSEAARAREIAKEMGVEHLLINTSEMDGEEFQKNPPERCYHCKMELFTKISDIAKGRSLTVVEGSQLDDDDDFRPGRKALDIFKVKSPLKEAGFRKQEVRELARIFDLESWNSPQQACLASRIPYGERITDRKLEMIEKSESLIRCLGFKQVRVRYHEGDHARIELGADEIPAVMEEATREEIAEGLKKIGFKYVSVDVEGYRQGSLNEALSFDK